MKSLIDQLYLLPDLQSPERGTWLGINRSGRFAVITNYRDPNCDPSKHFLSRGIITKEILKSDLTIEQQLNLIKENAHKYGGFNLICSDLNLEHPKIFYLSNKKLEIDIQQIPPKEFYGLSNSLLEDPWPKVKIGVSKFKSIVKGVDLSEEEFIDRLLKMLSITVPLGPELLTDETINVPIHDSKGSPYATRTNTIVLVDYNNNVVFVEKTLAHENFSIEKCHQFKFKFGELNEDIVIPI
ncbi:13531_t:CDS:2 [Dentiscutata erythropus]|uniref:13531_t:CDS:1 n=1 Tax=Dentiscutata erythropus TaxID=1348616 RepID=A0A9N8YU52_9GLOM|nr:13531_t:CDS:2 [Dentiscutata erythropus]